MLYNQWSQSQAVGATVWGTGHTKGQIFMSAENLTSRRRDMHHGAYDTETATWLYEFDDKRDGEEISLNPSGW